MSDKRPPAGEGWNAPGTCGGGYWRVVNGIYESWSPTLLPAVTIAGGVIYSMPPSKAPSSPAEIITTATLDTIVRLTQERDKAREDCGFQKGLKDSIKDELHTFIRLRQEALDTIAERDATIERLTYDRNHPYGDSAPTEPASDLEREPDVPSPVEPCPDSCGGQSWTGVNTNYGRRWRCDTCGRIVSQYVSNPMQAADDRRAL
jgi:hypothetical protein